MASKLSLFLAELKRRKVTRVAVVYALVGLGMIEGASMILPTLQLEAAYDYIVIFVLFGFPVALVLAWALEVTPQGIQKTTDLTPEQLASQTPDKWRASSWIFAGIGLIVVLTAGYLVFFRGGDDSEGGLIETRVAVMPFEDRSGQPDLQTLGLVIADVLSEGLNDTGLLEVVPTSVTIPFAAAAGPGNAAIMVGGERWTIGDESQAGTVIRGAYYELGDSIRIQAEITDERTSRILNSLQVTCHSSEPMSGVREVRQEVLTTLALRFDPRVEEGGLLSSFGGALPRYEAYQAYIQANAAVFQNEDLQVVLQHSLRALELDSTFVMPLGLAAFASQNDPPVADSFLDILEAKGEDLGVGPLAMLGVVRARLHGDLEGEYRVSREGNETWHGFAQGTWNYGWAALRVNRPAEALEALLLADPDAYSLRSEWGYWRSLTVTYHVLGRHEDELLAARTGSARFPDNPNLVRDELVALAALGRVEEVLEGIEGLVISSPGSPGIHLRGVAQELRANGYPDVAKSVTDRVFSWWAGRPASEREERSSRYDRAMTYYLAGDWPEAEELFAELHTQFPASVNYLGFLGATTARLGDREGALLIGARLANLDDPYLNGLNTLWRGRIAAILGEEEEAVELLLEAHAQGVAFWLWWHSDPAFENLRDYPPFQEFLRPKG